MVKNDILFHAVENLKEFIQLPINIIDTALQSVSEVREATEKYGTRKKRKTNDKKLNPNALDFNNGRFDALLKIGNENKFSVEVKKEVHQSNLPHILKQFSETKTSLQLLVAKTISKSAKDLLAKKNINYLDMAGNCYIKNNQGLYIQIEGKKLKIEDEKRKHLAFNKNGIKLVYTLFLDKQLINQSYTVMAETANISKSTVGSILKNLKEKNFLIQLTKEKRKLINEKELLDKWVNAYNEKLKPSLFRGKFSFLPNKLNAWKKLNLANDNFWGGEAAANLLTNYLSPQEWTIYSNKNKNDLLKKLQLVPNPKKGNISLYSVFWNEQDDQLVFPNKQTTSPLLVYADLIGTHDNRNFETAIKIYEQYLSSNFTE